jgi:hypothetical protein
MRSSTSARSLNQASFYGSLMRAFFAPGAGAVIDTGWNARKHKKKSNHSVALSVTERGERDRRERESCYGGSKVIFLCAGWVCYKTRRYVRPPGERKIEGSGLTDLYNLLSPLDHLIGYLFPNVTTIVSCPNVQSKNSIKKKSELIISVCLNYPKKKP